MKIAAIGTFDGVHRGHRMVIDNLNKLGREKGLDPVVITFREHPLALINPEKAPAALTPLWKKRNLLVETGVSPIVIDFNDEIRATTAADWMRRLKEDFDVAALIVGYDHTFGCDGVNLSLEDYKRLGNEAGIEIFTPEEIKGVSSSAIRKAVAAGQMEKAREMLGRPYSITAKVVKGNGLGHTIGFPTANIEIPEGVAIPKTGVYKAIVKTLHDGKKYPAMVNIGTRPTVMRGDHKVIEAHIIGWNGDLYGKEITIRFLKHLREEEKFDSIEALRQQLAKDKEICLEPEQTH